MCEGNEWMGIFNILLSSLGVRVTEPTPGRLTSFSARIDSCGRKSALCGKLFFFAWNGGGRVVPTHINAVYPSLVSHMWWLGTVCANFGPRTWTWFRKPLLGLTLRICRTQHFFFTASTTSLIGTLRLPFHLGECCIREAFHAISYTFLHLALLSGTLVVTNDLCCCAAHPEGVRMRCYFLCVTLGSGWALFSISVSCSCWREGIEKGSEYRLAEGARVYSRTNVSETAPITWRDSRGERSRQKVKSSFPRGLCLRVSCDQRVEVHSLHGVSGTREGEGRQVCG